MTIAASPNDAWLVNVAADSLRNGTYRPDFAERLLEWLPNNLPADEWAASSGEPVGLLVELYRDMYVETELARMTSMFNDFKKYEQVTKLANDSGAVKARNRWLNQVISSTSSLPSAV